MKICIMYDTQFGNGKRLAEAMGEAKSGSYKVLTGDVKVLSPAEVVNFSPDILILGGAIRAFITSPKSKKYLKRLDKELMEAGKTIQVGAAFLTHAMPAKMTQGWGRRFLKKIAKAASIQSVYPECLHCRVEGQEGPLMPGEIERGIEYITKVIASAEV